MPSSWTLLGWHYERQGQLHGLVSTEELCRLCAAGTVDQGASVWKSYLVNGRRQILQTRADLALGLGNVASEAARTGQANQ